MSLYGRTDSNANKTKVARTIATTSVAKTIVFVDETEASLTANKNRGINGPGWWSYFTYTDTEGNTRHKAEKLMHLNNADVNANETQSDDTIAADIATTITISSQPSNVTTYAPSGAILTFTEGNGTTILAEADEVYEGVTGVADGDGVGATFTITRDSAGAIDTVTLTAAGSGYVDDEEILIDGADIGGVTVTDDLVITVDTVATASATFTVVAAASPSGTLIYQWQVQSVGGTRWTNISGETTDELELTGVDTSDSGKKYRVKITSSTGSPEVISNSATLTVTSA